MIDVSDTKCAHCGHNTVWIEHQYKTDETYPYGTDEVSQVIIYNMLMCSTCSRPTLQKTIRPYNKVDGEWFPSTTEVLYPSFKTSLINLPEKVERRFSSALRVQHVEPNAFAVMVGKTLEAVCNHEKIEGKTLSDKLNKLATSGRIPLILAQMAQQLRQIRNLGAHDAEDEITDEDVPIILDFLEAILEYLYVAPAKIAAVQARLKMAPRCSS